MAVNRSTEIVQTILRTLTGLSRPPQLAEIHLSAKSKHFFRPTYGPAGPGACWSPGKKMSEAKNGTFDENPLGSSGGADELGARDQADAVVSMHSSPCDFRADASGPIRGAQAGVRQRSTPYAYIFICIFADAPRVWRNTTGWYSNNISTPTHMASLSRKRVLLSQIIQIKAREPQV